MMRYPRLPPSPLRPQRGRVAARSPSRIYPTWATLMIWSSSGIPELDTRGRVGLSPHGGQRRLRRCPRQAQHHAETVLVGTLRFAHPTAPFSSHAPCGEGAGKPGRDYEQGAHRRMVSILSTLFIFLRDVRKIPTISASWALQNGSTAGRLIIKVLISKM